MHDYSGHKALFKLEFMEAGCMVHVRRKFHELWVNYKKLIAVDAIKLSVRIYEIAREMQDLDSG